MRTAGADVRESAARLRVARLLEVARLEPGGRSPNAILIVRRLADPLPRRLARAADDVIPSSEWERAAQHALADCFDRAARPVDGPVPPSANAVRFDDEAQLLACLARDFLAGDAPARWWWRAFFRDASHGALALVVSAWLERPRAIPAAIAHLAPDATSTSFVGALSTGQVRSLFVALTDAFDLPALVAAANAPPVAVGDKRSTREHQEPADSSASIEPAISPIDVVRADAPPWQAFVGSSAVPAVLDVDRQTLLGVALTIWRAPLAVRSRRFEQAYRAWRQAVHNGEPRAFSPAIRTVATPQPTRDETARTENDLAPLETIPLAERDATRTSDGHLAEPPEPRSTTRSGERADRTTDHGADALRPVADRIVRGDDGQLDSPARATVDVDDVSQADATAAPEFSRDSVDGDARVVLAQPGDSPAGRAPIAPPSDTLQTSWTATAPIATVTTELGGILFVINALDADRLWDRFAEADAGGSPIGGWSWLALVARRLLGERADIECDPIWTTLDALDGDAAIGAGVDPLLDLVVPPLQARLLSALDIDGPWDERARALLAQRLLFRRAQLRWTATHVDLHMTMAQIDIAVRLAGLDANPGWVPALGRVVTFYFE